MKNKTVEGFSNIEVEIIDITKDPFSILFDWYKTTWENLVDKKYNKNDELCKQACFDILNFKALPISQEAINISFRIKGFSMVCLKQLTRSRINWSFNIKSQMPLPIKHDNNVPLSLLESKHKNRVLQHIQNGTKLYDDLIRDGILPQDARYLICQSQTTEGVACTNYLALRNFYSRRCCNGLADEINLICRKLRLEIKKKIDKKEISKDWEYLLEKLDSGCAFKKTCNNIDAVIGNCKRYSGMTKGKYAFDKSSWYLELKKINKNLLFDGEQIMLNKYVQKDRDKKQAAKDRKHFLQELYHFKWQILICCIFLNRTNRTQVDNIRFDFFRRYKSIQQLAGNGSMQHQIELENNIKSLGFASRRAATLINFALYWQRGFDIVSELPGIGKYGSDSWRMFVLKDYNFIPHDKMLKLKIKELRKKK